MIYYFISLKILNVAHLKMNLSYFYLIVVSSYIHFYPEYFKIEEKILYRI